MHRPKKNKIKNPTLPDDARDVDERNLIDAGESAELGFEDRVRMYWMENRGFVTGCIIALALIIIVFQGMRIYAESSRASLQEDFLEATAAQTLNEFAKANSGKALGGFAALEVADNNYEAGDYAAAIEFYDLAAEGLAGTVLAGRARLGHAFATVQSGDTEKGLAELEAITADTSLSEAVRGEAAYHLAIRADVAGDDATYERHLARLEALEGARPWSQRLRQYAQQAR